MNITLYKLLRELVGITTDVVVINRLNNEIVVEHSRDNMVADDVPKQLWKIKVETISVTDKYPNKLVVYVDL